MTDKLQIDPQGHVWYKDIRLPIRYENRQLEFVIKDKRLWAEHGKRIQIPLDEFQRLERRSCESVIPAAIDKSSRIVIQ